MKRLFFVLLLFLALPVQAIDIFVRGVHDGEPVFGEVDLRVEVLSAATVIAVEVRLDGELVAQLEEEPYGVRVDVGQDNRTHVFEVKVVDANGDSATRTVTTGMITVNMELDLDLQQLYVTVTRDGQRVLDLGEEDFQVLDEDARQELVTFERGDVPLTAALVVDSSLSMEGAALRSALAAAEAFVQGMADLDEAKVFVFSDRLLASTPFTGDPAVVRSAMGEVRASGGTAINDHLFVALKALDEVQGRRVLILLSDGIDVESILDMRDVAWKARRTQTLVYWIRPTAERQAQGYFSIWRDMEAYREELATLEEIVTTSGGRIREIGSIDEAAAAFRDILRELREQYVLGYYPSVDRDDGAWHAVRVVVGAPGVRVRARGGYFDETHDASAEHREASAEDSLD